MNKQKSKGTKFTTRTKEIIGRSDELNLIKKSLKSGGNQFIYFWANGGLGKTRLLEEIQKIVEAAGPGYYFSGILDLYLSDMHSNSDVERTIAENLDPEGRYFDTYREKRRNYELLRERGTDPQTLEKRRQELREIFVKEERDLAAKAYKVVICFDTVELLQYESSVVEQLVGGMDTRIKTWILDQLPKLNNVLVVFAGRPKISTATEGELEKETVKHHEQLLKDFTQAFGQQFQAVELEPLKLPETKQLILELTQQEDFIPESQLPIVHKLTDGNPVFLHLLVDLIRTLSPEPRRIYEMFNEYSYLVSAEENDSDLKESRKKVESETLNHIFNSGEMSGYLSEMALLPKGINQEVLERVLGLTSDEAQQLIEKLNRLSFVKQHKSLPGPVQVHDDERIFYHDEIYRIISPQIIQNLQIRERTLAQSVVKNYYDPLISQLRSQMDETPIEQRERSALRERVQKLQVERLYYMLVRSPEDGYSEYKQLTEYANRFRQVGFAMRLLDEFLRFYNFENRRLQCKNAGISHEQIVRESIQMWVERLHWWGERKKEIQFAEQVFVKPNEYFITVEQDSGILATIYALWARACAMLHGYEPSVVPDLLDALKLVPAIEACDSNQLLGLGRLLTSIGYEYRQGGLLEEAVSPNDQAITCFRRLGTHPEELAIVLNNQAYVVARQGRTSQGRTLALEALRINNENNTLYAAGLSRTILAAIERMALEDYSEAEKWALEAKDIFERQLNDPHGTVRAYLNLGGAWRKLAERDVKRGRDIVSAINKLKEAAEILQKGIIQATVSGLDSEIPGLKAELGKVNRSLGQFYSRQGGLALGIPSFRESERYFLEALSWKKWNVAERADITEDLAEVYFRMGDQSAAESYLTKIWNLLGEDCRLYPGKKSQAIHLPNRYYLPLGKVERLQGEIAMKSDKYLTGLQHFTTAYAYFDRYSKTAVEKHKMTESLYSAFLYKLSAFEQRHLIKDLRSWMDQCDCEIGGVSVQEFIDSLGRLMGG